MVKMKQILAVCVCVILLQAESYALTVVRMEMQVGSTLTNVDFELYDEVAPLNVANFLGYVNSGAYDNSFFHRKLDNFIVQGGLFTYTPEFDFNARFVNHLADTCLLSFSDPISGELGLRPIGEEYYLDADGDDNPDFLDPLDPDFVNTPEATGDPCDNLSYLFPWAHPTYVNWEKRYNTALQIVPAAAPVVNEFNLSNLRGTLAMGLLPDLPDSATNTWFVNLFDNSANLDYQSGGFTVFGKVMGAGMDFFDFINNNVDLLPLASGIHSSLGSLPVYNLEPFALVINENLVKVNTAVEILNIDISDYDFGLVEIVNPAVQIDITVTNQWASDLEINAVGDLELLSGGYSLVGHTCVVPVLTGNSCVITVAFDPTVTGDISDVLDVSFISPDIPNVNINLTGIGVGTPPRLVASTVALDYEFVMPGDQVTKTITLTNLGTDALTFDPITSSNAAYTTSVIDCPLAPATLAYTNSCTIDVTFSPQVEATETGTISISTDDPQSPLIINVTGVSTNTIQPVLSVDSIFDLGDLEVGIQPVSKVLVLSNIGNADLNFLAAPVITGTDFALDVDTSTCFTVLAYGASCEIGIKFEPTTLGEKTGTVEFTTDDPVNPVSIVDLVGTSSSENDNVSDLEEDAGSNNGDGNNDGILDSVQRNVVSIEAASGAYITLVIPPSFQDSIQVLKTEMIASPSAADEPNGVVFNHGYLSYEINGQVAGLTDLGAFDVVLIVPIGVDVVSYYQYGPTPDNATPHWYEFLYDGVTGAQIQNRVSITPEAGGTAIERNIIYISYKDGARGDNDLVVNGLISSVGGSVVNPAQDNSGQVSIWYLLAMITFLTGLRNRMTC